MEFEIAHRLPGRLRLRLPLVARDPGAARALEALLRALPGVGEVDSNPVASSLVIGFDPAIVGERAVTRLLDTLTPAHLQAPTLLVRTVPVGHQHEAPGLHLAFEREAAGGLTEQGLRGKAGLGVGFKAEQDTLYDHTERFMNGALAIHSHLEEHLSVEVALEASCHGVIALDRQHHLEVDLGFEAGARAVAVARGMAEVDIALWGWRVGVEGYVAFTAGEELEVAGWVQYHEGVARVGAIADAGLVCSVEWGAGLLLGLPPALQESLDDLADVLGTLYERHAAAYRARSLAALEEGRAAG